MAISVLNAPPGARCAIFPLKNKQSRFSWKFVQGIYFSKRLKTHFKVFFEMLIVLEGSFQDQNVQCPYKEGEEWKLLRMSAVHRMLPCFEYWIRGPKIDKYVVWRWWYKLFCQHKNQKPSLIANSSQPNYINYIWTFAKKGKKISMCFLIVLTTYSLIQLTEKKQFQSHFIHFQSTVKQHGFLKLQQQYWVVFWLWTRLSWSENKWSRPWNGNKFQKNPLAARSLLLPQRQDFLVNHLTWIPNTPTQKGFL